MAAQLTGRERYPAFIRLGETGRPLRNWKI